MTVNINLARNTRVWFTTLLGDNHSYTDADTFELQVMNGYSFSQATEQQTIQITEAGATPTRGQRSFNTKLNPVDWKFSTYVRPNKDTTVTCPEKVLWNALASKYQLTGGTSTAWTETTAGATLVFTHSEAHNLAAFALIFKVDNTYYKIDDCAVNSAEISFGIDQIAMINWSGFGTVYSEVANTDAAPLATLAPVDTTADFIVNKLSTVAIQEGISGTGTTYTLPITGGTLTIANNLTYLTPEILGVVNQPIGYFTGTRAVSGNLTAYLRTGDQNYSGALLTDILAAAAAVGGSSNSYELVLTMGGSGTTNVVFNMPAAMLQVPTIDVQDVVSTTINFTAQGNANSDVSLSTPNEISVVYHHA